MGVNEVALKQVISALCLGAVIGENIAECTDLT